MAGLNRCILDQGRAEFRRQLAYKMDWSGGLLLVVPAHHTSQTCPSFPRRPQAKVGEDVNIDGHGGGTFSLEGPEGKSFLTRSRVFTEDELTELAAQGEAMPPS